MKRSIFLLLFLMAIRPFKPQIFSYTSIITIDHCPQPLEKKIRYKSINLEELIDQALAITMNDLTFSLQSMGNSDVNFLSKTKRAHCVGYANYFNSVLYQLVISNKIKNIRICRARAKVSFLGINMHLIDKKEFKDHDISVVYDEKNNKKYFIDPSLSEVFGKIVNKE